MEVPRAANKTVTHLVNTEAEESFEAVVTYSSPVFWSERRKSESVRVNKVAIVMEMLVVTTLGASRHVEWVGSLSV